MIRNRKTTGKAISVPAGLMIGTGVSLTITVVFSLLLAKLVSAEKLEWEKIGYGIVAVLILGSTIGAKIACILIKRRKMMVCGATGVLYWVCLLLATALFFGGQYSGLGVTAVVVFCGNAIVCMQELRGERRKMSTFGLKTGKKRVGK